MARWDANESLTFRSSVRSMIVERLRKRTRRELAIVSDGKTPRIGGGESGLGAAEA